MASTRKPEPPLTVAALAARLFRDWALPAGARLKLAYSGGLDSHVLLHALASARQSHCFHLSAIYIDHGLQPESASWGEHCARSCAVLGVPFEQCRVSVEISVGDGPEAAARRARYVALAASLEAGESLLTAHHQDDQAETLLLQLLRGCGPAGLAAMPERAPFARGELLRPLLDVSRASLAGYASAHGLAWIDDPSNLSTRFRRNYLRAEIVPRLEQHWPEARRLLARSAAHAAEAQWLLDERAAEDCVACRHADGARYPHALEIGALASLSPARLHNLLRHWLRRQGFLLPDLRRLDELCRQISREPRSRQACVRWEGVEVWRYRDRLVAVPSVSRPDPGLDASWDLRSPLTLAGIGQLRAESCHGGGLSPGSLHAGLRVRLRHGGETVRLPGRAHHQQVKKLLQSAGVPPWERLRLPILYAGGAIAAIADRWVTAGHAARDREPAWRIVWEPYPQTGKIS